MRALPLLVLGVLLASAPPVARADRDMCVFPRRLWRMLHRAPSLPLLSDACAATFTVQT